MRSVVTDRVAWSVGRYVGLSVGRSATLVNPAKRLNRSRCRFGCELRLAIGTMFWRGPDPPWEEVILRGKGRLIVKYKDSRPCAVAMRPFCQITLTTCYYTGGRAQNFHSCWYGIARCTVSRKWNYITPMNVSSSTLRLLKSLKWKFLLLSWMLQMLRRESLNVELTCCTQYQIY